MRTVPRLFLAIVVATMLLVVIETPARAETISYDVTSSTLMFFTAPVLGTATQRIQIIDRGPQTDGSPRWTTESPGRVFVWDQPGGGFPPDMLLFGNSCTDVPIAFGNPLPRHVQVTAA